MTDQLSPITPPPELLHQWAAEYWGNPGELIGEGEKYIAIQAARWGSDQELEACCEWAAEQDRDFDLELRAARRPKPPSLKAGAIEVLDELDGLFELPAGHYNTILRALEQLDD